MSCAGILEHVLMIFYSSASLLGSQVTIKHPSRGFPDAVEVVIYQHIGGEFCARLT